MNINSFVILSSKPGGQIYKLQATYKCTEITDQKSNLKHPQTASWNQVFKHELFDNFGKIII
jgi:hypothetical protein